ncbi:MAG: hypothetical protein AB7I79_07210 [Rhizobiaceae bacterium]
MRLTVVSLVALFSLSGCVTSGLSGSSTSPLETTRTETRTIAMGGGLVAGAIGQGFTESERRKALEAEYRALEYTPAGQKITWKSDDSGRSGEVVAAQAYRVGSQDCRQYQHTVFGGSQSRSARGTACRNADGSWTPLT